MSNAQVILFLNLVVILTACGCTTTSGADQTLSVTESEAAGGFRIETGEYLWKYESGSRILSRIIRAGDFICFTTARGTLVALESATGKERFVFDSGKPRASSPLYNAGRLYFQNGAGVLFEIDAVTGMELRRLELSPNIKKDQWDYFLSAPVVENGRLFLGNGDKDLLCMDMESFTTVWTFKAASAVHSRPVVAGDSVLASDMAGRIYRLNKDTGEPLYQAFTRGPVMGSPVYADGRIYAGSRSAATFAFDFESGEELWTYSYGQDWVMATPLVRKGKVYIGGSDSHMIQCLDGKSGQEDWRISVPYNIACDPVYKDSRLYFTAGNAYNAAKPGGLLVMAAATGRKLYRFNTVSCFSSPLVEDERVYLGNESGEVFCVEVKF